MEGFVNEKVYDIDTKEKLLDIIQSKEARENFLEFIYDHHAELEKWQQYYQERSRIRIIEWLRNNHFTFVFEEDLDLPKSMIEKLKRESFPTQSLQRYSQCPEKLDAKAKTYYSNEAFNPRPKRGRPPKQAAKIEIEPQISTDIYTTVPSEAHPFLFVPDFTNASAVTFSSKFDNEEELLASRKSHTAATPDMDLESLNQKLAALRSLSNRWLDPDSKKDSSQAVKLEESEEEEDEDFDEFVKPAPKINGRKQIPQAAQKKSMPKSPYTKPSTAKPSKIPIKKETLPNSKKPIAKAQPLKKAPPKKQLAPKSNIKTPPKKSAMRSIMKKTVPVKKTITPAAKKKAITPKNRRIMVKNKRR